MRFLRVTFLLAGALSVAQAQNDWRSYGGTDPNGSVENRRYSSLKQIDTSNVAKLTQAWTYNTRPTETTGAARASQVTPLVVNGVLYLVTYYQSLVAMEPESGKQIWAYNHPHAGRPPRGIAYWRGDAGSPAEISGPVPMRCA